VLFAQYPGQPTVIYPQQQQQHQQQWQPNQAAVLMNAPQAPAAQPTGLHTRCFCTLQTVFI